jgi:hypothetical protein
VLQDIRMAVPRDPEDTVRILSYPCNLKNEVDGISKMLSCLYEMDKVQIIMSVQHNLFDTYILQQDMENIVKPKFHSMLLSIFQFLMKMFSLAL